MLGNILGLAGFDFETSEAVRNAALGDTGSAGRLDNRTDAVVSVPAAPEGGLERVADVPIYAADALVRRSPALQSTADGGAPVVGIPALLWQQLGLLDGAKVRVSQGAVHAVLPARAEDSLPVNVVRVAAGHADTAGLGAMFGPITVENA